MGRIYLAGQRMAGIGERECVIKEMLEYFDPNDASQATKAEQRFRAEAKALMGLNHPGIPQIFDYFSEGSRHYIVMEHVKGANLEQRLTHADDRGNEVQGSPYSEFEVAQWGMQVCKILEYLARLSPPVVHNDIKPANLVLDQDRQDIRLVDFGTAQLQSRGPVTMSQPSVYGTPGYAPPEQYQGASGPKSDVYALAATLYHLATDDDPRGHPFGFPCLNLLEPALADILRQALDRDIAKRPSAAQLRSMIEKWLSTSHKQLSGQLGLSGCIVLPMVAEKDIQATISGLQALGGSERQATIFAYGAPKVIKRVKSRAELMSALPKAQAAGVLVRVAWVDESWSATATSQEKKALEEFGEIRHFAMRWLGPTRECQCSACGHIWTSRRSVGSPPPETCPQCKSREWNSYRLFKCRVCGHEFVHTDRLHGAEDLFPHCPACATPDWLPTQAARLSVEPGHLDLGAVRLGETPAVKLRIRNSGQGSLRGIVRSSEAWLDIDEPFIGDHWVRANVRSAGLAGERTYVGSVSIFSSGGSRDIQISMSTQTPERLQVQPGALDLGLIGSQEVCQTLRITNIGGGKLAGSIASDAPWLVPSTTDVTANVTLCDLQVRPGRITAYGARTTYLRVSTNGGDLAIPVSVCATAPSLQASLSFLSFGAVPPREKRLVSLRLTNSGSGTLEGRITSLPTWVGASQADWVGNDITLDVEVSGAALLDGAPRSGVIRFESNGGNLDVPVSAQVLGPTAVVDPVVLNFQLVAGRSAKRYLHVNNPGIGELQGEICTDVPWLHARPARFSGNHVRSRLSVSTKRLHPGNYVGKVEINSNGGQVALPVSLHVAPRDIMSFLIERYWLLFCAVLVIVIAWGLPWRRLFPATPARPLLGITATATNSPDNLVDTLVPPGTITALAASPPTRAPTTTRTTSWTPSAALAKPRPPTYTPMPSTSPTRSATITASPTTLAPTTKPSVTITPQRILPRNADAYISSPTSGAVITGLVRIVGTASIHGFDYYKLEYKPEEEAEWRFLKDSHEPVRSGLLLEWETSQLAAGAYDLRLVVVDGTGNYPEPHALRLRIVK